MPRETVHPINREGRLIEGGPQPSPGLPTIQVGWHSVGNDFQIGLETPIEATDAEGAHQRSIVDYLYGGDTQAISSDFRDALARAGWTLAYDGSAETGVPLPTTWTESAEHPDTPDLLGQMILDAVTGTTTERYGHRAYTGWYTHIDRSGANRFITLIRRARDKVFGRDA